MENARCDVSFTPAEIPSDLRDAVVVVMDVLRATTTIVYALQNGARSVIPCEEPSDAVAVRDRLARDGVVLGGERDSVRIPGFDLDNSPLSYTGERVQGKTVVFTTTNGTRALRRAMQASPRAIVCAGFVNLSAVVDRVLNMAPASVLLACAGSEGTLALEDALLAGAIADRLGAAQPGAELSDAAKSCVLAYGSAARNLAVNIASSEHAQVLIRAGFADDVAAAARIDSAPVVPILRNGEITAGT